MRTVIVACLALAGSFCFPLGAEEEKKDPGDRLLEAQLLEVSTGDLEKAKALYQAIQADEKAPPAVRERALLYLARCHRKLGEIEPARSILEDLVKGRAKDREVLRQAQSFLRELRGGKPESPEFDWLKEIERNPEIQSRVFDLAMDLVNPESESGKRARKQLLALGPLARPVLERVIETTRDPGHRQQLAMILVQSGQFERLPLVLDPRLLPPEAVLVDAIAEFGRSVRTLSEEERGRLKEALSRLPPAPPTDQYRDVLLLSAGDASDLSRKLLSLERFAHRANLRAIWNSTPLDALVLMDPGAPQAMSERILDMECPEIARRGYFDLLLKKAPEKLKAAHWEAVLKGQPGERSSYYKELDRRKAFDVLIELASAGDQTRKMEIALTFQRFLSPAPHSLGNLAEADPRWAAVLRAARTVDASRLLGTFAMSSDGAVAEYAAFLRNRESEVSDFEGDARTPDGWRPSPRFVEAMVGLLEVKDRVTLRVALEALGQALPGAPPEVFAAVEKLLGQSESLEVRSHALMVLARRFADEPATGPALAKAFLAELERSLKTSKDAPKEEETSQARAVPAPGAPARPLPKVLRRPPTAPRGAPVVDGPPGSVEARLGSVAGTLEPSQRLALYPHLLALADSEAGALLQEWWFWKVGETGSDARRSAARALIEKLDSLKSREFQESARRILRDPSSGYGPDELPRLTAYWKGVAGDEDLPLETRLPAIHFPNQKEPAFEWIDWLKLLERTDLPSWFFLVDGSSQSDGERARFWTWVKGLPEAEKAAIFRSALKSPEEQVRARAIRFYPADRADAPQVFRAALEDPSQAVATAVKDRLRSASRADMAPIFIDLLSRPERSLRLLGIEGLKRFAVPQGIEALVKLLEDPDIEVRNQALSALKEIRQALEEKKQWEELVRGLKKAPAEKPREP